jgi:hypothetical protein
MPLLTNVTRNRFAGVSVAGVGAALNGMTDQ